MRKAEGQLENLICFAVYSANLAFSRIYRPLLDDLGLTYLQYIVLVALWERDGQLVGELGDRLYLVSSTLTPVLQRLETLKYLQRLRDDPDERRVRVRLTDKGHAVQKKAAGISECIVSASGMSEDELATLHRSISGLRDGLLESDAAARETARSEGRRKRLPSARRATPAAKPRAARVASGAVGSKR